VDEIAARINRRVADEDPAVVILQLLDNSVFYVKTEDGSRHLPRQDGDGVFHVDGELRVCAGGGSGGPFQGPQANIRRSAFWSPPCLDSWLQAAAVT
jgi:hypothetical protein